MLNADFICDRLCTANDVVQVSSESQEPFNSLSSDSVNIALQDSVVPGPGEGWFSGNERFRDW